MEPGTEQAPQDRLWSEVRKTWKELCSKEAK